ncbi:MAG: S8 family serine peptidase [Methanospirillum sp.]|uniref:S8 family serine peptidase n=1 Tax=Methanospirillum sp. TaxID=45200 RepID=UPI002369DD3F|nr:S8 family serine peptidase [Methanospirillum sp.]MDD1729216.1 S8 family serine peptidase [Methanospirillum sp.]
MFTALFGLILFSAAGADGTTPVTGAGSVPVVSATPAAVSTQVAYTSTGAAYVPGEVIVRYKTQNNGFSAESVMSPGLMAMGAELSDDFSAEGLKGMQLIHVGDNATVQEAVTELHNSSFVEYAEPNYLVSLMPNENSEPPGPEKVGAESVSGGPNDPRFIEQWALDNTGQDGGTSGADIHVIPAWAQTTGSDSVVVAVIDTGVDYNHPDLAGNIWTNPGETPGNGVDDDGNGYIDDVHGWNFVTNSNDPMDDNGHGTHCAGVIGAVGNNGIGISGINQKVKIMPLKILGKDGNGDMAGILKAIAYARSMGANVISCSWGGTTRSEALGDAIAQTSVPVICAAGNSGVNTDVIPQYPSGFDSPQIISVAASDASDGIPNYSNYGTSSVDVAAPGDWILSTYPTSLGYDYIKMKGTSMATPQVSGLAALILSVNPGLSADQIKQLIVNNVDNKPAFTGKIGSGGRIDAEKTLTAARGGTVPTQSPTESPTPVPTQVPSVNPTEVPTEVPYERPTQLPTQIPTINPTQQPTQSPPGILVKPLPGMSSQPRDLNNDGKYEDLNGDGICNQADIELYFRQIEWIAGNEPVEGFDLSGNGRIDFTDIRLLYQSL